MTDLLVASSVSLPPITYKGLPVVTTEQLARAYECEPKHIRQNFANNKSRFVEGRHFHTLTNGDLKEFRLCVENFDSQIISPKIRNLTLWLERGAARHAKMLNTDRAWDTFEMLEETFFRVVRPESAPEQPAPALTDAPITPDQQCTLQALVRALVEKGGIYAAIWSRFNNHFRLGSYKQLPQSRMSEAVDYLARFDAQPKALPEPDAMPEQKPLPAGKDDSPQRALAFTGSAELEEHYFAIKRNIRSIRDATARIYDIEIKEVRSCVNKPDCRRSIAINCHEGIEKTMYAMDNLLDGMYSNLRASIVACRL